MCVCMYLCIHKGFAVPLPTQIMYVYSELHVCMYACMHAYTYLFHRQDISHTSLHRSGANQGTSRQFFRAPTDKLLTPANAQTWRGLLILIRRSCHTEFSSTICNGQNRHEPHVLVLSLSREACACSLLDVCVLCMYVCIYIDCASKYVCIDF